MGGGRLFAQKQIRSINSMAYSIAEITCGDDGGVRVRCMCLYVIDELLPLLLMMKDIFREVDVIVVDIVVNGR